MIGSSYEKTPKPPQCPAVASSNDRRACETKCLWDRYVLTAPSGEGPKVRVARSSFFLVAAVGVTAAISALLPLSGPPSVLRGAKRAYRFANGLSRWDHQWINDHTILATDSGNPTRRVVEYDLKACRSLRTIAVATGPQIEIYDDACRISPNGRFALWIAQNTVKLISLANGTAKAISLADPAASGGPNGKFGNRNSNFPTCATSVAWGRDSQTWFACQIPDGMAPTVTQHDLRERTLGSAGFGAVNDYGVVLGTMPNGHVVAFSESAGLVEMGFEVYGHRTPIVNVVQHHLAMPPECLQALISIHALSVASPDGTRILWWTAMEDSSPLNRLARRLIPNEHSEITGRLSVSNADGGSAHDVGQYSWAPKTSTDPGISQLRWMPDSRHISFIHDNSVWVKPI